jgi:hypothetical protein
MQRDGVSRKEALSFLKKIDKERSSWSKHLYGIDTSDPSLYDLVVHIRKYTVDDAVNLICSSVNLKQFQTTAESQKAMDDLALAAEVKAALIDKKPDAEISAHDGVVSIETKAHESQEHALKRDIEAIIGKIPGVKEIRIEVKPVTIFHA